MDVSETDVNRVVWDWRGEAEAAPGPEPVFGRLVKMLIIMGIFAGIALWRGHRLVAAVLGTYALINVLMAVAWPRGFRGHARFWEWLGRGGAAFIGTVSLTILYFVLFTPAAAVIRLLGRRPLELRFRSDEQTYWHDVEQKDRTESDYKRQF
jgi:hypothetical protein